MAHTLRKGLKRGTKRKRGGSPGTLMQLVSSQTGGTLRKKRKIKK
jgi:hypothetical protein